MSTAASQKKLDTKAARLAVCKHTSKYLMGGCRSRLRGPRFGPRGSVLP